METGLPPVLIQSRPTGKAGASSLPKKVSGASAAATSPKGEAGPNQRSAANTAPRSSKTEAVTAVFPRVRMMYPTSVPMRSAITDTPKTRRARGLLRRDLPENQAAAGDPAFGLLGLGHVHAHHVEA